MTARTRRVLDEALDLPPVDRAVIAAELEASLETASADEVEKAWTKELTKRLREVREGRVKPIPAGKVLRDARKRLRATKAHLRRTRPCADHRAPMNVMGDLARNEQAE